MEKNYKEKPLVVALDIGTTKVCVLAGVRNEYDKLEVLGMGHVKSDGVTRGVVVNIDRTVKAISEAIRTAELQAGTKFKNVHVGIAGQHIKSFQHSGHAERDNPNLEIVQEEVDKLISSMNKMMLPPGDKILHIIPQEFTVDGEHDVGDPVGMFGRELFANFHIITGQITSSRNIRRSIEKVGLRVSDLTLEPIASATAVLSEEEKIGGVALVDIGGGTTDISIFKDGILRHTAVVPFGGHIITKDIQEGCTVLYDQAEKLKVKYGSALASEIYDNRGITINGYKGREQKIVSEKNLAHIIESRVTEIFEIVNFEIQRSGLEGKLFAGLVLTGGGAMLKNINLLVEYLTGLPTRIGEPVEHLAHGYISQLASPIYSTAIGLLNYAIDNQKLMDEVVEDVENEEDELVLDESIEDKPSIFDKFFTMTKDFFAGDPEYDEF